MTNFQQRTPALTGSACLEKVLQCLEKVRPAGASKWRACCPAHNDKNPSLTITETSDGVVLLRCWAGCSAQAVVSAIGLEMRDLFPGNNQPRQGPSQAAIEHEQMVYRIGKPLADKGELVGEDLERYELAKHRLGVA